MSLTDLSNLESSAILSLSSEKKSGKEKGYWVDALSGELFGSDLWTLKRSPLNSDTLRLAEEYAKDALSWLVRQGLAKEVNVASEIKNSKISLNITLDGVSFEHKI